MNYDEVGSTTTKDTVGNSHIKSTVNKITGSSIVVVVQLSDKKLRINVDLTTQKNSAFRDYF